jgi:hypothetical protein
MREAWEFEERGLVTALYRRDREAVDWKWADVRAAMLRAIQRRYGPRFPDAMMRIAAWIETEETWVPEDAGPQEAQWSQVLPEERPLVLRLKVTIR